MITFESFLEWVVLQEKSLQDASSEVNSLLRFSYEESYERYRIFKNRLPPITYKLLIFRVALHWAIYRAVYIADIDVEGNTETMELANALQKLYMKYSVYTYTAGVQASSSSAGVSSGVSLPRSVSAGDLDTSFFLSTPYGREAESILQQLGSIVVVK